MIVTIYPDLFDGDTVSIKPAMTVEANQDAERQIQSPSYILSQAGKTNRPLEKDFLLTQYMLTLSHTKERLTRDCNVEKPKYAVV